MGLCRKVLMVWFVVCFFAGCTTPSHFSTESGQLKAEASIERKGDLIVVSGKIINISDRNVKVVDHINFANCLNSLVFPDSFEWVSALDSISPLEPNRNQVVSLKPGEYLELAEKWDVSITDDQATVALHVMGLFKHTGPVKDLGKIYAEVGYELKPVDRQMYKFPRDVWIGKINATSKTLDLSVVPSPEDRSTR